MVALTILLILSLSYRTYALSACEIDVTFIIDYETIIHEQDEVVEFISSIIDSGSAENTGFSVVVYGDGIPKLDMMNT